MMRNLQKLQSSQDKIAFWLLPYLPEPTLFIPLVFVTCADNTKVIVTTLFGWNLKYSPLRIKMVPNVSVLWTY